MILPDGVRLCHPVELLMTPLNAELNMFADALIVATNMFLMTKN